MLDRFWIIVLLYFHKTRKNKRKNDGRTHCSLEPKKRLGWTNNRQKKLIWKKSI